MDANQILKQLNKELNEKIKCYSRVLVDNNVDILSVQLNIFEDSHLLFCIKNDLLILIEETYDYRASYSVMSHNIVIGNINVDHINDAANLFLKHWRARNIKNPTMDELLQANNRFTKTKSARNTE